MTYSNPHSTYAFSGPATCCFLWVLQTRLGEPGNGYRIHPAEAAFFIPHAAENKQLFTQGLNRYSYVLNNPTKYTDPSGYRPAVSIYYKNNNGGGLSTGAGEAIANSFGQVRHLNNMSNLRMDGFMERSIGDDYDWGQGRYENYKGQEVSFTNNVMPSLAGDVMFSISNLKRVGKQYVAPMSAENPTANQYLSGIYLNDGSLVHINDYSEQSENTNATDILGFSSSFVSGFGILNSLGYRFEWEYLKQARINRALSGNFSQPIRHSLRAIRNVGTGATFVNAGLGIADFALSDQSWGDYGQLGVSLLSTGLTLSAPTAPIGMALGAIDAFGGFNGFYNQLDAQQNLYNNTGGIVLPINGFPQFIEFN